MARFNKNQYLHPDAPLLHEDHGRPMSRRQFIRQGFMTGSATVLSGGLVGTLLANPAFAAISPDLQALQTSIGCSLVPSGAGASVPFICFDLAGGANLAGSNVLVGQGLGQMDLLSTAGYNKLGLPGDMLPGQVDQGNLLNPSNGDFTNSELNLVFHADSAMLAGIRQKAPNAIASGRIDGCVIPARSDNDTGNNPHSPLYGLVMTGARGEVVDLIGSRSSVSGGNSMAPPMHINPEFRPTKVDRPSDVTGMVDVGDLTQVLGADDVTAVMESIVRATHKKLKLADINTELLNDAVIKDLIRCNYLKAADITDRFATIPVDPLEDTNILSAFGVATANDLNDNEFRKTASIMKMVLNGYAAGGCVTMGGYDYHTGDRTVGENRDLRAGRCIGACLEYAQILGKPLMIYVFSDGSVFSNGMPDNSTSTGADDTLVLGGEGKGQWTGDNSSTACSFFLAYDPAKNVPIWANDPNPEMRRQIGRMSAGASVVTSATPMANNVNLLVNMVLLNFMALNGKINPGDTSAFTTAFPNHGLGSNLENYIAFGNILPP
ncbi:MAG: general secretion pathway protein GspF [Gammaproteobacteria bacterium]|nr:general secretion pathway protein GspF [Gammaproteobacteria bacterium]